MDAAEVQKKPQGKGKVIIDLVIQDLRKRDEFGRKKYGESLKSHNGRNALLDAYQEALDLCMYLRQTLEEQEPETAPSAYQKSPTAQTSPYLSLDHLRLLNTHVLENYTYNPKSAWPLKELKDSFSELQEELKENQKNTMKALTEWLEENRTALLMAWCAQYGFAPGCAEMVYKGSSCFVQRRANAEEPLTSIPLEVVQAKQTAARLKKENRVAPLEYYLICLSDRKFLVPVSPLQPILEVVTSHSQTEGVIQ